MKNPCFSSWNVTYSKTILFFVYISYKNTLSCDYTSPYIDTKLPAFNRRPPEDNKNTWNWSNLLVSMILIFMLFYNNIDNNFMQKYFWFAVLPFLYTEFGQNNGNTKNLSFIFLKLLQRHQTFVIFIFWIYYDFSFLILIKLFFTYTISIT